MAERQGRSDLLEVVAQQKEQLVHYETRLKDVVRAYKGLAKEMETLEKSLAAITAAVSEEMAWRSRLPTLTPRPREEGGAAVPGPCLAALSSSLMSAEKLLSEVKFMVDKRMIKKERAELVAEVAENLVWALQLELDSARQTAARGEQQLREQAHRSTGAQGWLEEEGRLETESPVGGGPWAGPAGMPHRQRPVTGRPAVQLLPLSIVTCIAGNKSSLLDGTGRRLGPGHCADTTSSSGSRLRSR
jgi:hypothetical protein